MGTWKGTLSSLQTFLGEGKCMCVQWLEGQKREGLLWGIKVIMCCGSIKQKEDTIDLALHRLFFHRDLIRNSYW